MIVAGLMSGTSCDGIDVALADLRCDGSGIAMRLLGDAEIALPTELQARVRQVMAGEAFPARMFCQLDTQIGQAFASALLVACERIPGLAPDAIDLICSHGQTLWHWEEQGRTKGTLQMGNPAWIAERTGIAVVSDLRMRDVAAGGNGAPLVGLVDAMLAAGLAQDACGGSLSQASDGPDRHAGPECGTDRHWSVGFLNLGGIANITVIESTHAGAADSIRFAGDSPSVLAYDIGPANALIDLAVARFTQGREHYDRNGQMAARGSVDPTLLAELLAHPYYRLPLPRSTGKETFSPDYVDSVLLTAGAKRASAAVLDGEDVVATFTAHAARLVADAVERHGIERLIISGGGAANPVLRHALVTGSPATQIMDMDQLGMPGSAKEAYAFAVLGFLSVHGLPGTLPGATGSRRSVVLGSFTPGRMSVPWLPLERQPDIARSVLPLRLILD